MNRSTLLSLSLLAISSTCIAQQRTPNADVPAPTQPQPATVNSYVLGPGDQLTVLVTDLDVFNDKTFRIDTRGDLSIPIAGRVHAAGLSIGDLQQQVAERLIKVIKDPDVVISVSEFGSQSVSILGAVGTPGVRQIEGGRKLFEVLSLAGGLRPDAGYIINITRDSKWGPIPLANAKLDPTGVTSVASVKVKDVMNAINPAENIVIFPGDVISVPKADLVYAVGLVTKPGGFLLNEHESLSALQVISLAEGLQKTAAADRAKILRQLPGSTNRAEIAVDLKQIMSGKGSDIQLQANDILFVPGSSAKAVGYKTVDIMAGTIGAAIYATR